MKTEYQPGDHVIITGAILSWVWNGSRGTLQRKIGDQWKVTIDGAEHELAAYFREDQFELDDLANPKPKP